MVAEVERKRSIGTYIAELEFSSRVSLESSPQINDLVAAWDLGLDCPEPGRGAAVTANYPPHALHILGN